MITYKEYQQKKNSLPLHIAYASSLSPLDLKTHVQIALREAVERKLVTDNTMIHVEELAQPDVTTITVNTEIYQSEGITHNHDRLDLEIEV